MLKYIFVFCVVVVLVFVLVICGEKVIVEELFGVIEGEKEVSGGENNIFSSDNWVENLFWNFFGYVIIIILVVFIIWMFKNLNFNEKSGKLFLVNCICVLRRNCIVWFKISCYR